MCNGQIDAYQVHRMPNNETHIFRQTYDRHCLAGMRRCAMTALGWWSISGETLLGMLREVRAGADPDHVYAEHYANSKIEHIEGRTIKRFEIPPSPPDEDQ
jgi:hypothetical protein